MFRFIFFLLRFFPFFGFSRLIFSLFFPGSVYWNGEVRTASSEILFALHKKKKRKQKLKRKQNKAHSSFSISLFASHSHSHPHSWRICFHFHFPFEFWFYFFFILTFPFGIEAHCLHTCTMLGLESTQMDIFFFSKSGRNNECLYTREKWIFVRFFVLLLFWMNWYIIQPSTYHTMV